ncbi:MAG: DivIVA domain-containing protein [Actinomycetes bacterium]
MDVTPQELREVEIREAFRGYHRDDVDELLERAAATIEHLEHQIRILQDRLASSAARPAPEPAPLPAAAPAPAALPAVAAAATGGPNADVIQRTLILAQRAADEALSEAQARAHHLTTEAESRAHAMVTEAETTARRIAETERRRIEAEISQLGTTRDALTADVDALVRFATDYRARIRRAIESELQHLAETSGESITAPVRPVLRTEGIEFAEEAELVAPAAPVAIPAPAPAPPVWSDPVALPESTASVAAVGAFDDDFTTGASDDGGWTEAPAPAPAPVAEAAGWGEPAPEPPAWAEPTPARGAQLDDDAFFASLRDAVRDDEPLGAGGEFFDDQDSDDDDGGRGLFRRRR